MRNGQIDDVEHPRLHLPGDSTFATFSTGPLTATASPMRLDHSSMIVESYTTLENAVSIICFITIAKALLMKIWFSIIPVATACPCQEFLIGVQLKKQIG